MLRRPLVVLGAALVALTLVGPALAVRVHVRIEGATRTLYGAKEPLVTPKTNRIRPPAGPDVHVTGWTALGTLDAASRLGEFYYEITSTSFGPYVSQIGRYAAVGATGWVFKVNGQSPPVGAHQYHVRAGDRVLWYFARFGPSGGPRTLELAKSGRCYEALGEDDAGAAFREKGVTFKVNSRRVTSASGRFCPTGNWGTLRGTKKGLVRSQVVTNPER